MTRKNNNKNNHNFNYHDHKIGSAKKHEWHALSKDQVLDTLKTNDKSGLTDKEARARFEIFGPNAIREEKKKSTWTIFAKQFKEPLILILLAATAISALVGELVDSVVIVAIIILSTIVGFVQEYKSEKAIEALKKMAAAACRVIRDGEEKLLDVSELVPGDVILVSAGDRISADAFLIESFNLESNEAPLTGESVPVRKVAGVLARETPVADRQNILYTITTVTHGRGKAVVFATGMNTELGKIASAVQRVETQKTPFEIRMRHIGKLLSVIMLAVVGVVSLLAVLRGHQLLEMLVWSISLAVAAVPEALPAVIATSLTLGVYKMAKQNAIIRRLPAVETLGSTTIICSDKTGTLTKGEMTVTRIYAYDSKPARVTGIGYSLEGDIVVSAAAAAADGLGIGISKETVALLAKTAALCNDASIKEDWGERVGKVSDNVAGVDNDRAVITTTTTTPTSSPHRQSVVKVIGDPTEIALLIFARKAGVKKEDVDQQFPRIQEVSFTSERKMMTTIHRTASASTNDASSGTYDDGVISSRTTKQEVFTKGAVEAVLSHCSTIVSANFETMPLSDSIKDKILSVNNEMASSGLRVLALAYKTKPAAVLRNHPSHHHYHDYYSDGGSSGDDISDKRREEEEEKEDLDVETNLSFLGLVGMIDPARPEVIDAVAECKTAGIDVVMITGDHKLTALAVAEDIGIASRVKKRDERSSSSAAAPTASGDGSNSSSNIVAATATAAVSGVELDTMDSEMLEDQVEQIKVYSRVSPEHKLRIVQALKKKGHVVAMTGDGTNDAPALKAADIGIAMGITGTQVTKESSSMILADDNFATIVSAVKEGRRIFDNVKKYLVYLLTANIGEIIILAFSVIAGWPFPLLAKHILYINLATDGSPAIALGLEPYEPDIMRRKPRNPNESLFFGIKKWLIGIPIILAVTSLSLFWYVLEDVNGNDGLQSDFAVAKARTMMFGLVVFFELFFAISCRSFTHNINRLGFLSNKTLVYSLIGETFAMLFIMNYPAMQEVFELVPLRISDWILMLLLSTTGFIFSEVVKIITTISRARQRARE
jgi:Ca2+-transporting ATPase